MKSCPIILLAFFLNHALAQQPGESPAAFRDVATHEQLVQGLRAAQQNDPMKTMPVAAGEDPSVSSRPADLLSQSDVICFNGLATLVPKRAILASPENLKGRRSVAADARIVGWSEFLAANRGWITTEEVSFQQAAGKLPLPEVAIERIAKSANLVVATYLGGPISVMPPAADARTLPTQD